MRVREFKLRQFSDGKTSSPFSNGLRPKEELNHNTGYLSQATNIYLSEDGCFDAEKFTRTFSLNEDAQIFSAYKDIFVLTSTVLYKYSNSTLTSLISGLTLGGMWSMADFGNYLLFTNGEINLIRDPETGIFSTDFGRIFPLAKCISAHRGRLVLGGPKNYPEEGEIYSNWVAWSDVNNIAFVKPNEIDQARQNLSGYMPMPWEGNVLRLASLDNKMIVYGDNGITALPLVSTDMAASTYGQAPVYEIGLRGQRAMTTNSNKDDGGTHYFVDNNGWLCMLDGNLEVERIGYEEFLN